MPTLDYIRGALRRAAPALALLALTFSAGCAFIGPAPAGTSNTDPAAANGSNSEPSEPAASAPRGPSAPPVRPRFRHDIVVLFAGSNPGHADVAAEIVDRLPSTRYRATLADVEAADGLAILGNRSSLATVAVGLEAVEFAREHLNSQPIVFCQVLDYQALLETGRPIWGVSPLPPLELQLRGWKSVDRSLGRIGLIVSEGDEQLVDTASSAALQSRAELMPIVSSSDRETLYLFKRRAPELDGVWLLPDSRILSPNVLRELLDYALTHEVSALVFSAELLRWGALLSATSRPRNIAAAVESVLDRVMSGETEALPAMTPLSEAAFEVNAEAADRLGLSIAAQTAWVLREPD